jgi:hypothetical protein
LGDTLHYPQWPRVAVTTFGVITGRDYFMTHASPAVFLYPQLLWDVKSEPRDMMRDFCRNYFGSEQVLDIYDSLAEADRLVYVERHRLHSDDLSDPRFVAATVRALKLSGDMLRAQTDPERRARFARLMQEVTARFVDPKMLITNIVAMQPRPFEK